MNRPVIVLFIVAGIIAVCVVARVRVDNAHKVVHAYGQSILAEVQAENAPGVRAVVADLQEYWRGEQRYLVIFFRHTEMDEISRAVSKLEAHAQHEEWGDLAAEMNVVLWQIDHIWENERIKPESILATAPFVD